LSLIVKIAVAMRLFIWLFYFLKQEIPKFFKYISYYGKKTTKLELNSSNNIYIIYIVKFILWFLFGFFSDVVIIHNFLTCGCTNSLCSSLKIYSITCIIFYIIFAFYFVVLCFAKIALLCQPSFELCINKRKLINIILPQNSSQKECTICADEIINGIQLKCGHVYHKNCIESWLKIKNKCPLCNQNPFENITQKLFNDNV
jgi:hypothetical protein